MSDRRQKIQLGDALDSYQAGLARDGDVRAFDLLYRRWHPKLLRLATRLTRNPDEAQDVMQDAALTMARGIRKLKDPARFSAWACTIVRRRSPTILIKPSVAVPPKQSRLRLRPRRVRTQVQRSRSP